ncbi:MAG: hypothetical protein U0263_38460 [Polyangiaceae bacterium]
MAKLGTHGVLLGLALVVACSANGGNDGAGAAGGGAAAGAGGDGATGAGGGNGGSGGGIDLDSGGGGTGATDPGDAACETITQEAHQTFEPADISWAVDTSGSMVEEAQAVQLEINDFSKQIVASNIDVHVVMLAAYPFLILPGICVPGPLGSGMCPPQGPDTNLPYFWHHPTGTIDSVDGALQLVKLFPDYKFMLRPGVKKYVVIVSDDDSRKTGGSGDPGKYDNNPDGFIADYTALDPMMVDSTGNRNWKLSGIYSFTMCPNAAAVGQVWKDIIDKTGGVHGDICDCPPGQPRPAPRPSRRSSISSPQDHPGQPTPQLSVDHSAAPTWEELRRFQGERAVHRSGDREPGDHLPRAGRCELRPDLGRLVLQRQHQADEHPGLPG